MRTRIIATVVALVGVSALVAPATQAETPPVNPYAAAYITTETTQEEGSTPVAKVKDTGGKDAAKIGTCSGSYRTIWRTQYINNTYGVHLAHIKESTTFYWNGSRVTCSWSGRSAVVDTYGAQGGWEFKGWTDGGEQFYTYNGHTNGGVKSWAEGWFKGCNNIAGVTLCSTGTVIARTYGHYDGGYTTGGWTG